MRPSAQRYSIAILRPFDPTEFAQALNEGGSALPLTEGVLALDIRMVGIRQLLRARRERRRRRRTAEPGRAIPPWRLQQRAVGGRALPFAAIAVACLVLVAAALFARMAVAQAGNAGLIAQKNALEEQLNQLLAGEPAACAKPTH